MIPAVGAVAAYGGVLADAFTRHYPLDAGLVPGAVAGTLLLVLALAGRESALGWALFLAGASYIAAVAAAGRHVDATASLVALLLLLCGELASWSRAARLRIPAEEPLARRRGIAIAVLAFAGLTSATLVLAVSAVQPGHGLIWTALGAAAAVGAAGIASVLARR